MTTNTMHCPACGGERHFEQPPCTEDHGADCMERACVACGTAILAGVPDEDGPGWREANSRSRAA